MYHVSHRVCFSILCSLWVSTASAQSDWPQWMGPGRDNIWNAERVLDRFPEGGPTVEWRAPLAGGYSGPAVVGNRVYITDYVTKDDVKVDNFQRQKFTGDERVLCLDSQTGQVIWEQKYPVSYSISYPAGPRCTPSVDGDYVYTLGAEGDLYCFKTSDGAIVWKKNLPSEYGTKSPLWGYSAHPLIDGENLITLAGGEGSHIVALNKNNGREVWRSLSAPEQGYSPPTIIQVGDNRQLIAARPNAVSGLDPSTGKLLWEVPYEATSGSIIMSPVLIGEYLYIAGYSRKSLLLKLSATNPASVETVWRDQGRSAISPVNVQPHADKQVVYGFDQSGLLCALQIPEGNRLWESEKPTVKRLDSGTAFLVRQQDRYWLFNELGELILAQLSPQGYEELDRAKVIEPSNLAFGRQVVWSMPAFAGSRIFIRNDKEIICLNVSAK